MILGLICIFFIKVSGSEKSSSSISNSKPETKKRRYKEDLKVQEPAVVEAKWTEIVQIEALKPKFKVLKFTDEQYAIVSDLVGLKLVSIISCPVTDCKRTMKVSYTAGQRVLFNSWPIKKHFQRHVSLKKIKQEEESNADEAESEGENLLENSSSSE